MQPKHMADIKNTQTLKSALIEISIFKLLSLHLYLFVFLIDEWSIDCKIALRHISTRGYVVP